MVAVCVTGAYTTRKVVHLYKLLKKNETIKLDTQVLAIQQVGAIVLKPNKKLGEKGYPQLYSYMAHIYKHTLHTMMAHCIASVVSVGHKERHTTCLCTKWPV